MSNVHKGMSVAIVCFVFFASCLLEARMYNSVTNNLITFLSIMVGFYMTSISMLFGSSLMRRLYKETYMNNKKIYILRSYILSNIKCAIISIISLIIFKSLSITENEILIFKHPFFDVPVVDLSINLNSVIVSALFSMALVNILYMWMLIKFTMESLIQEARNIPSDNSKKDATDSHVPPS